jgi:hypothetical protein
MNIIQTIAKANYAATGAQVALLAHAVTLGKFGESTYLNVLAAHFQAEAGTGRRKMPAEVAEAIIDKVHAKLYPHVQQGVQSNGLGNGGEEMPAKEVNRRSTFARTSASELRGFIARGGDIRTLEVGTITRAQLRKFGVAVPTGTRAERSLQKSTEALTRAAKRVARGDPDAALERINAAIEALQAVAEEIEAGGEPAEDTTATTVVGVRRPVADRGAARTRVGVPQLHRGA